MSSPSSSTTLQALRVGWGHLRPLRRVVVITLALMLATSVMESVSLGILVPIMEQVQGAGHVGTDPFSRYSAWILGAIGAPYGFVSLMLLFSAAMFVRYALQAWLDYVSKIISASLKCSMRVNVYHSLMRAPRRFFHRRQVGELISTAYTSADEAGALGEGVVRLLSGAMATMLFLAVQLTISPLLTVISLGLTGFSYWFVLPRIRRTFEQGGDVKTRMDQMIAFLQETLSGIGTVKAFRRERHHEARFEEINRVFLTRALEIQKNKIVVGLFMEPYMVALVVVLIIVSVTVVHLGIAPLITFFVVFSRMAPKVKQINSEHLALAQGLPHFIRVQEIIDAEPAEEPASGLAIARIDSDIRYEDVHFRYDERDDYALRGVTFSLPSRRTTALVGSSGGGKSTIANILLGHYRPLTGTVRVNGRDLWEYDRAAWLGLIGVVDQEPFLFHGTIADNIRYGLLEATQEQIEEAARLAHADEFVARLPERYETIVGDRGVGLSVGQKQRIALARALVRNPELLILDEATSALDSQSEQFIRQAIDEFNGTKTILIIAHRLSTVVNADRILFLEKGRIIESGNHESLLAQGGRYADNYRLQVS